MKTVGTNDVSKIGSTVHKFELAGLGKAPFRFLEVRENAFTIPGTNINKPGGCCDYCYESIRYEYVIKSADGKFFKVGCDCVAKVGDEGLRRYVDKAKRDLQSAKRRAKADAAHAAVKAETEALMADPAVIAALESLPHAYGYKNRETGQPLTMLDQVKWMLANSGRSGHAATLGQIKKAIGR